MHIFTEGRGLFRSFELYIKSDFLERLQTWKSEISSCIPFGGVVGYHLSPRERSKTFREAAGHNWRTGRQTAGHAVSDLKNFQKKCLTKITDFVILYRLSSRARAWKDTGRCQAAPRKAPLKPNIWQLNRNAALKISFRLFIRSDFKHRIWKELQRKVWTNQTKQITERWTKQIS